MHPRTCDLFAIAGVLVYHVVGRLLAAPTCGTPDNYRLQITTNEAVLLVKCIFLTICVEESAVDHFVLV